MTSILIVFITFCQVFLVFETYLLSKLHFKYSIQTIFSEREYWRVAKMFSNTVFKLHFGNKKIYFKGKKFNQIYFQTDFKYCFRGILKINTRSHGLDRQNAIDMQIQPAKRNKNASSRHCPFYKDTILKVEPS